MRIVGKEKLVMATAMAAGLAAGVSSATTQSTATFAGGCFWCMEAPFEQVGGVTDVVAGYTGGTTADPTYEDVCSGRTGHYEAIQIAYDPTQVTYERLLDVFWRNIDPTDEAGQFADKGSQYHTAVFYHDDLQKCAADRATPTSGTCFPTVPGRPGSATASTPPRCGSCRRRTWPGRGTGSTRSCSSDG